MNKRAKKPVFVVFEGMDGAGKSDVSKMVASQLSAEWMTTPPKTFATLRKAVDEEYRDCGLAAQLFYASTVAHASERVKEKLARGQSVVMDRYAASTLAYDKSVRTSGVEDSAWVNTIFGGIVVPDITFYIQVSAGIRLSRMRKRGEENDTDVRSIDNARVLEDRYKRIFARLRRKSWNIRGIKNESTKEECMEKCIAVITEMRRILAG